jgi:hypothetical protein
MDDFFRSGDKPSAAAGCRVKGAMLGERVVIWGLRVLVGNWRAKGTQGSRSDDRASGILSNSINGLATAIASDGGQELPEVR